MSEDRCDCCDLPVMSCGKAAEVKQLAEERAENARLARLPGATIASYAGQCGECGEPFEKGTPIKARSAPGHRQPIDRSALAWRSLRCCP